MVELVPRTTEPTVPAPDLGKVVDDSGSGVLC